MAEIALYAFAALGAVLLVLLAIGVLLTRAEDRRMRDHDDYPWSW